MKSERVVSNPENHGWEEVNGKWIWASGRNTGHITDGDLNGETTVWKDNQSAWVPNPRLVFNDGGYAHFTSPVKSDDRFHVAGGGGMTRTPNGGLNLYTENNAGQVVLSETGNVGIGTSSPSAQLTIGNSLGLNIDTLVASMPTAQVNPFIQTVSNTWNPGSVAGDLAIGCRTNVTASIRFFTGASGPVERLTIDSTGNATFSGGADRNVVTFSAAGKALGTLLKLQNDKGNWNLSSFPSSMGTVFDIYNEAKNASALSFDQDSNATFSGGITAKGFRCRAGAAGNRTDNYFNIQWDSVATLWIDSTRIGTLTTTRELIETLATLRASTLDETVDVRQALASACDKLIEKFESMQEVATQEIEEETDANTN